MLVQFAIHCLQNISEVCNRQRGGLPRSSIRRNAGWLAWSLREPAERAIDAVDPQQTSTFIHPFNNGGCACRPKASAESTLPVRRRLMRAWGTKTSPPW